MPDNAIADGMEEAVKPQHSQLETAIMAMHNAFGYSDDRSDLPWSADVWRGAANAAQNVADMAETLADAARRIAYMIEDEIPDEQQ